MTKAQLITALAPFQDSDSLMLGDSTCTGTIKRICGKGQYAMPYICILSPGHEGQCFCGCKHVHFTPESPEEQQRIQQGET